MITVDLILSLPLGGLNKKKLVWIEHDGITLRNCYWLRLKNTSKSSNEEWKKCNNKYEKKILASSVSSLHFLAFIPSLFDFEHSSIGRSDRKVS